jgi:hypothetical protein
MELNTIERIGKDIIKSAEELSDDEARYLVDAYYIMQDDRKRAHNQCRAVEQNADESHSASDNKIIQWLAAQSETLENQIKRALDKYTDSHPMGSWMRETVGIGPVISAGLLAHIDIEKAPTVGHIWRYAGLDPTVKWEKGQKRPWNATLKTLCWKAGQSFMKFSGREDCYYGQVYRKRKAFEIERNDRGDNKELAAEIIKKVGKTTEAYKHLLEGKLPPGQIDARARRYAVKLFLSHLHGAWYLCHFGVEAPLPYPIAILGHAHLIERGK